MQGVAGLLGSAFIDDQPVPDKQTKAFVPRTQDFESPPEGMEEPVLTVFPYRVAIHRATRPGLSAAGHIDGRGRLGLELHFLLTAWAENAPYELRILGRAMEVLESIGTLTGPMLPAEAGWGPDETIQVVPGDITTEEIMRTFDSLPVDYKLSVPYIARVVRIDTRPVREPAPAVVIGRGLRPEAPDA